MKKVFLIAAMLVTVMTVNGEAKGDAPVRVVESFLEMLKQGDISNAYDRLFMNSNILFEKPEAVEMIKTQTAKNLPLYGHILGYEKIHGEKFGSSIIRLVYVLKSEKVATVWEFYFYKPESEWFVASIQFNDKFDLLEAKGV